jgi:hypothetical protein
MSPPKEEPRLAAATAPPGSSTLHLSQRVAQRHRTTPPVPWPRSGERALAGTVVEIDHLGPSRLPVVIVLTESGVLRSVACWGTGRRAAEKVKVGDLVRVTENKTGAWYMTVLEGA